MLRGIDMNDEDILYVCTMRNNCPKYTRGKCKGEKLDVDMGVEIFPVFSCVQEPWQKKLNKIKTIPMFKNSKCIN